MDKKLLSLLSLFFLTFGIFAAVVVFNKPLTQFTRAKEETTPSASTSLIIGWPLTVKADGKEVTSITVFVRSSTSKPVTGKPVSVTTTLGTVKEPTLTTDNEGKAVFSINSTKAGTAEVSATIDNSIKLNQNVSVKFE